MLRLFQTGHLEEARVIDDLRSIGCEVLEKDPATGEQWVFSEHGGHFGGSMDAAILGIIEAPKTWHNFEGKTVNKKWLGELKARGVEKALPKHYAQMQTYMRLAELKRSFYAAVCKDNDEIYPERIRYDRAASIRLSEKALRIIKAKEPLTKISENPESHECKFCDHSTACSGAIPPINCRTCAHVTPELDGDGWWVCELKSKDVDYDQQVAGCADHIYIPALLPWASAQDAGDGWVGYQVRGEERFFCNVGSGAFPAVDADCYSSESLFQGGLR